MHFAITPLYAALAAIILMALSFRVIRLRRSLAIGLGTGGDSALEQAVRAHGNFTEYAPIGLILLGSAELAGAAPGTLHAIGILLIVGRAAHAVGLSRSRGASAGRSLGVVLTFTALSIGVVVNLTHALGY
ncbi:membrane protein [Aliidongia dinghuensis]|uniref:Membrane protein n=1 Tax=Aliidongia dinghuensis TaxID=1867774 RepID=A0A8J3E6X0_9PROT|nr:MAPEG family protein [Aliidongia dinghuensis]GGF48943.1 membrane protein [Aliidongia dinghuensis]